MEEFWKKLGKTVQNCGKNLSVAQKPQGRTYGILNIIFGGVSFIIFGLPLGFAAIVCGAVAVAKDDMLGIVGIVLGVIGALLAFILLLAIF